MLVGVHFIHWITIYTLDRVICSLNNRGQNDKDLKTKSGLGRRDTRWSRTFSGNFITVHINLLTHLSWACKSLDGFQFGSNMITTLAPVKFSPRPPALVEIKQREILGSRLKSHTRRVLSAGLVRPSNRLYTSPGRI